MELKEGMYVRSNLNFINKIIAICPDREKPYVFKIDDKHCEVYGYKEYQIKNASYNIAELLKVGDFLDNHYIVEIKDRTIILNDGWFIDFDDVEDLVGTIVTKEMFESMSYKVGD